MKRGVVVFVVVLLVLGTYLGFSTLKLTGNFFWDNWFGTQSSGFSTFGGTATNGSIVYQCGTINSSGSYSLNQSINATDVSGVCLNITSDNVVLDGAGFNLFGNGSMVARGISAERIKNITVKNFKNISSLYYGIYFDLVNNSKIQNLSASLNGNMGVNVGRGYYNVLADLVLNSNSLDGLAFSGVSSNLSNITANYNARGAKISGLSDEETTDFSENNLFNNLEFSYNHPYEGVVIGYFSGNTFNGITTNNNTRHGIDFEGEVYNNNFNNVVANNNSQNGLDLDSTMTNEGNVSGNVFNNVVASYNKLNGIYLYLYSHGNNFSNVVADYNLQRGVYVKQSPNNNFMGMTVDLNNYGVYLQDAFNSTITSVIANSNVVTGIHIESSSNNSFFTNVTANNNGGAGVRINIESGSDYTFTNITANNNLDQGIYLAGSSRDIFSNVIVNNNSRFGVEFQDSSSNSFTNIAANNNSEQGIYISSSSINLFRNGDITGTGIALLFDSLNNSLVNMSYNQSDESVEEGSELYRKWWLDASSNVADTTISWSNGSASGSGNSPARFELTEYYYDGASYFYAPLYTVSASKADYSSSGSQEVNMSGNRDVIFTMTCSANCGGGGDNGGGNNGGGGGASTGFWTNTYTITNSEFENGYSKELRKGERIKFFINGMEHYAGIVLLGSNQATINISSKPQQVVFSIGDEKKFDVSGDGNYDLSVKLSSIANNKAGIFIKKVSGDVIENTPPNLDNNRTGVNILTDAVNLAGGKWWIYAIVILVVLILLVLVAIYFAYRWRKNQAIESLKSEISM